MGGAIIILVAMFVVGPIGLFVKTRPELESPDIQYQFLAGSLEKAGAEWKLICLTHNLLKLFRSGWVPQAA